jgi:hypothetical protein
MASQSLTPPFFCPVCNGHDVHSHGNVLQCHDCGHVIEEQPQPEVK